MSRIVRAICATNSFDDSDNHRVKITCKGVFSDLEVDSLNGLYLRKGDEVYVFSAFENWYDAIILGRCNGQLELQNLVDVINKLIDIVNEDKKAFEGHTHVISTTAATKIISPNGSCSVVTPVPLSSPTDSLGLKGINFADKEGNIKCDDLLK